MTKHFALLASLGKLGLSEHMTGRNCGGSDGLRRSARGPQQGPFLRTLMSSQQKVVGAEFFFLKQRTETKCGDVKRYRHHWRENDGASEDVTDKAGRWPADGV